MRKRHLHLYLTCPDAAAPLFEFAPVSSSGPFSIDGHEVFMPQGGVDVTLEVFLSASGPRLVSTYQAQILGETSYAGGDAGFLTAACHAESVRRYECDCALGDESVSK